MIITKNYVKTLAILLFSVSTHASELSVGQDKLARLEQIYENQTEEMEDLEDQLIGYRNKVDGAEKDLVTATAELDAAAKTLLECQSAARQVPSVDADRALKLADHAHDMAERGVRTRTKRLERLQGNLHELEAQATAQQALLKQQEQRMAAQKSALAATVSKLERQADQQARAAQLASVEASRVADKPAQPANAAAPAKVASAKLETTPIFTPAPPAASHEQVLASLKPVPVTQQKPELSDLDQEELAYVQKEAQRLAEATQGADTSDPTFKRLTLDALGQPSVPFTYLGGEQYRVEVPVIGGKQVFSVRNKVYRRTIPAADDGAVYVFIYDARRLSRPRLVSFKKSLLDYI